MKYLLHTAPLPITVICYAKVVAMLSEQPCTYAQMVAEIGMTRSTIAKFIAALRKEGCCYIAAWTANDNGRRNLAMFQMGSKQDAKQPSYTDAEKKARYRRRNKERIKEKAREKYRQSTYKQLMSIAEVRA